MVSAKWMNNTTEPVKRTLNALLFSNTPFFAADPDVFKCASSMNEWADMQERVQRRLAEIRSEVFDFQKIHRRTTHKDEFIWTLEKFDFSQPIRMFVPPAENLAQKQEKVLNQCVSASEHEQSPI